MTEQSAPKPAPGSGQEPAPQAAESARPSPAARPTTPPAPRPTTAQPARAPEAASPEGDLERVRAIIVGSAERGRPPVYEAEDEPVRDVLVGARIEEYERRFADLRRDIDRVLNDLRQARDAMDEFRESQRERLDAVERDLRQSQEDLGRESDRIRSQGLALQQLIPQTRQLNSLAAGLTQQMSELRATLTRENQELRSLRSMVDQYRDQYERSLDTLKREKRQAEDELKEELRRIADRLDDAKVDRKTLAALLGELATRLETGGHGTAMLEALVTPDDED